MKPTLVGRKEQIEQARKSFAGKTIEDIREENGVVIVETENGLLMFVTPAAFAVAEKEA